ncbi:hypothetical protein SUNI508_12714 [Seiridium unicorne]|uniref:Uncharacterized protein n=1 Tax=Seiridium unicorne TaxID=138068 RepID=A0ABR2VGG6_9PEZI
MDPLRSNLAGYYTPQQYTPVPLPTYPPPTFSTPSPYPQHQYTPTSNHSSNQAQPYDHSLQLPAHARAAVQALAPAHARRAPAQVPHDTVGDSRHEENHDGNGASTKSKSGGAPKGFGRTSAVYQVDGSGVKRRVNAEDFRAQVEERTRNGESCEQIAEALISQGAQVTSKSVSRWRIQWGFRKRAVRKQSKPPKPKEQRMNKKQLWQSKYKADITRMTQQGLEPEDIAQIMTARGMQLKKGSSTIARLQTVWKLRGSEASRIKNKRYLSRRKARQQQIEEFQNYARELGLENPDEWIKKKMEEPAIKQMRRSAAYEMMGDAAPAPKDTSTETRASRLRTRAVAVEPAGGNDSFAESPARGATEDAEESSDGGHIASGSVIAARSLRSSRLPVGELALELDDSDSDPSDGDPSYQPMDGIDEDDGYAIRHETENNDQYLHGGDNSEFEEANQLDLHDRNTPAILDDQISVPGPAGTFIDAAMALILSPAEQENTDKLMGSVNSCIVAAQFLKDLLQARSQGRPAPRSLIGLPPSAKDIETARHKLAEAAQATVDVLQMPF